MMSCATGRLPGPTNATTTPKERGGNAHPLNSIEAFFGQELQSQRGEQRRRVEEHHGVSGRGVYQGETR